MNHKFGKELIFINALIICSLSYTISSKVLRPRGVSLSRASLYDPAKPFTCFDGSNSIPFNQVNDDYCDCTDGSDEPGTAACTNGYFYCNNADHIGKDISSSYVNDGVCDCCDSSDEYASSADCLDSCQVLGAAAQIEAKRLAEVQMQGYNIRQIMADEGLKMKTEKQARVAELNIEKENADLERTDKLQLKEVAEVPEKEALEKYKEIEEEINARKEEEKKAKEELDAREAFAHLDTNNDGILTIPELQARETFDTNRDGSVSEDEAKFYFQQSENMDLESFLNIGWALMKPTYQHHKRMFIPPSTDQPPEEEDVDLAQAEKIQEPEVPMDQDLTAPMEQDPVQAREVTQDEDYNYESDYEPNPNQEEEVEEEEEEEEEEENADYDEDDVDTKTEEETAAEEKIPEIQYDEETQRLVDIASAARQEFETVDTHVKDLLKEIQNINEGLEKDFGPNEEFRVLENKCYDFSDREYTYKLCPFNSAAQIPKSGHGETRLGSWGNWEGSSDNPYSVMKYTSGQQCWNGPMRTAEVQLLCDVENALVAVSEPNRCEYQFIFHTPAVCTQTDSDESIHQHSEL